MWNFFYQHIIENFKKSKVNSLDGKEEIDYENKIKYLRMGEIISIVILLSLVIYMMWIA